MLIDTMTHDLVTFNLPHLLADVLQVLIILIIIDVVISYLIYFGAKVSSYHPFVRFVRKAVNPFLDPIRRALPPYKTGNLDFSPMIVIFALQMVAGFLYRM